MGVSIHILEIHHSERLSTSNPIHMNDDFYHEDFLMKNLKSENKAEKMRNKSTFF